MNAAIEVQNVSKRFRLYKEKYTSLKERVLHAGHLPFEEFWALKDIKIDVMPARRWASSGATARASRRC